MGTDMVSRLHSTGIASASLSFILATILTAENPMIPEKSYTIIYDEVKPSWSDSLLDTPYRVTWQEIRISENDKIDILHGFANKLLNSIEDLEPNIIKALNEDIWDLI